MTPNERFEKYQRWAESLARYFCMVKAIPRHAWEDMNQAGLLALWECARKFDPARKVTFSSFAFHRVIGAMKDEIRSMAGAVTIPRALQDAGEMPVMGICGPSRPDPRAHEFQEPIDAADEVAALLKRYPERNRRICYALGAGQLEREVAVREGVSESRVSQIFIRIRRELNAERN